MTRQNSIFMSNNPKIIYFCDDKHPKISVNIPLNTTTNFLRTDVYFRFISSALLLPSIQENFHYSYILKINPKGNRLTGHFISTSTIEVFVREGHYFLSICVIQHSDIDQHD